MNDLNQASRVVTDLLHLLTAKGDLNLTAKVNTGGAIPEVEGVAAPELTVELAGADTALLTDRNGELLYAIEHLAAKALRLEPEEHDRISFDAAGFKAGRDRALRESAAAAIAQMREQGASRGARPYVFPAMTSRERRLLHLLIAPSGLKTASTGVGPARSVVLYPEGMTPPAEAPSRPGGGQRSGGGQRYGSSRRDGGGSRQDLRPEQPATTNVGDPRRRPRGFSPR